MGEPDRNPLTPLLNLWQTLKNDHLLRRVLRNSSYLFSSNGLTLALASLQSILAARLLGVTDLGILGITTVFASTINRLFSFRMGDAVVRYLGDSLPKEEKNRSAALVKVAALTEASSSFLAFLLLILLAPLAARVLTEDAGYASLFRFYGISILGNLMYETATGVLQSTDRFRQQAWVNLAQSLLTAGLILVAFLTKNGLWMVTSAYLVGKLILGITPVFLAWRSLDQHLGRGWWRASLQGLPPWKELGHFALTTNLSATVNLLVRDSELLWVALFLDPTAAGYYKIALAISSYITIPITPFISTTYPEISRSTATRAWAALGNLLKRVTLVSGVITAGIAVMMVLFGQTLILLWGAEYLPAYPAMLVLVLGYGFSNLVFWNRPLLLSLDLPAYPFWATLLSGALKILLAFLVIPVLGVIGAAALLSGYFLVSGGAMALRGIRQIQYNLSLEVTPA